MKTLLTALGMAVLVSLGLMTVAVFGSFAEGYVLSKLWEWYAVPLGYRAVNWTVFAAIMLGLGVVRRRPSPVSDSKKKPDWTEVASQCVGILASPWFSPPPPTRKAQACHRERQL